MNSLFLQLPADASGSTSEVLEWLGENLSGLVNAPGSLRGCGTYVVGTLGERWLEVRCPPNPSALRQGAMAALVSYATNLAAHTQLNTVCLSAAEGSLHLTLANAGTVRELGYQPGAGWVVSTGVAQPWERLAFFSDELRHAALAAATSEAVREEIQRAYGGDEVKLGSVWPAPSLRAVLHSLGLPTERFELHARLWLPDGRHVEFVGALPGPCPPQFARSFAQLRLPVSRLVHARGFLGIGSKRLEHVEVDRVDALNRLFAVDQVASAFFQAQPSALPGDEGSISFPASECRVYDPETEVVGPAQGGPQTPRQGLNQD